MTKLLVMARNTGVAARCVTRSWTIYKGKLDKLLSVLPEIQDLKIQVAKLEKEKEEHKERSTLMKLNLREFTESQPEYAKKN